MCVSLRNWKTWVIGCCLAVIAVQAPANAQLFKRRGNRQDQAETENSAQATSSAATGQAATGTENTAPPADLSRYQVPNTTNVEELVKYLAGLLSFQPQTKEEMTAYRQRAPQAMTLAAQKILMNEKDENSDNYMFAEKYLLAVDVMSVDQATQDEKVELMNIIIKNLKRPEMDADDLDIAVAFTEGLEMCGDKQMATQAYTEFANVFRNHEDAMLVELGQLMAGSARRLNLIGKTINVQGNTLSGQPFNWNAYQGKVVLIDFWATWCGPCIKELSNLKEQYAAYHDRGFEVVGICMNEKREHVDQFMGQNELPWVNLFEGGDKTNPTAVYYGITSLPTTILIDQQGRVVTMAARGEELKKQLETLLGPAN